MATKVSRYLAADGKVFNTAKEADTHSLKAGRKKDLLKAFEGADHPVMASSDWNGIDHAIDIMVADPRKFAGILLSSRIPKAKKPALPKATLSKPLETCNSVPISSSR